MNTYYRHGVQHAVKLASASWTGGGAASEKDIAAAEAKAGIVFPSDYRRVISANNGARPAPNALEVGGREVVVERLIPVDGAGSNNVAGVAAAMQSRGHGDLVPFARDPFGNFFCFRGKRGSTPNEVVFWDHERGAVTKICETITQFLAALRTPAAKTK